jgi:hypothetical protein
MTTFALQPAAQSKTDLSPPRGNRLITPAELKLVDGLTIRYRRHWPLSFIEENVARCRAAGKLYTLLVVGGDVKDPAGSSHLLRLEQLIATLGAKYATDPLCWGVHCGLPPYGHSEELFWGKPMPAKALTANVRIIRAWTAALPNQVKLLAGSANDAKAMLDLIDFCQRETVGQFVYKINSLSAKTDLEWLGVRLVVEAGKLDALIGFEMLCGSNESRFGGTWSMAMVNKRAIEKRAGKKTAYLAVYKPDLAKAGAK